MNCPNCSDPLNLITERHENYTWNYYRCDNWVCTKRFYPTNDPQLQRDSKRLEQAGSK